MTARFNLKARQHSRSNSTASSTGGGRDLAFPVRNELQQPDTPPCCHSETVSTVDNQSGAAENVADDEPHINVVNSEGKKERVPVSALAKSFHVSLLLYTRWTKPHSHPSNAG